MRGPILQVLNLNGHHGAGERPSVVLFLWFWWQEFRRQRRVKRVCKQDKLELDLEKWETEEQIKKNKQIQEKQACESALTWGIRT